MLSPLPQMPVYPLWDLELVSGKGSLVYDTNGIEYLDMYGGHAVAATGHCHPRVVKAIAEQAGRLLFYSNVVDVAARGPLCETLIDLGPKNMRGVFLCNSGAEANENALTLARLVTGRRKIVSVEGGFHGRTLLTLSISGLEGYRALACVKGAPLFTDAVVVPFGDADAARAAIDETCAAVIIEPVQGLGGCRVAPPAYLEALRQACDQSGAMLIFDEVQCGTGRCGAFTAGQIAGVQPNLVALAKGLASGFPIAAVLADATCCDAVKAGSLGSTFGGGPLACAAALANLEAMQREGMIDNARLRGSELMTALKEIDGVQSVEGAGLLIGIHTGRPASEIRAALQRDHHILAGTSARPEVLRIMPPLNLNREHADRFVGALQFVLKKGSSC